MSEVVGVEITSNATNFPYEKKFPSSMTLLDVKKKLELVVGALAETMKVELHDAEGKFMASLSDDTATLRSLNVKDGMRLHIIDTSGCNEQLQDPSGVAKYEMNDETYSKRENSTRVWKQKKMAEMEAAKGDKTVEMRDEEAERAAAQHIKVDDRCEVRVAGQMARRGRVAFIGDVQFNEGVWVGVHYDEPVGKNNGTVKGVKYFECADKNGGFVRPLAVHVGDFPELPIDDDGMEEI